jgi:sulfoxide reductase heme-binding subunit YedZ
MVLLARLRANWLRIAVHAGALVPAAYLGWAAWQGLFRVDLVREVTTLTGKTALVLLVLSLACTPIHTLTGYKAVQRVRRALGMYAFFYAGLHFLTFVGLDYRFDLGLLGQAVLDQPYVLAGLAAGVLLVPLALTSTRGWQRRLGKSWKRLHRLVYLASTLAVLHFLWLVKDGREPIRYAVVLALLLALRIPRVRQAASRVRCRLTRPGLARRAAENP